MGKTIKKKPPVMRDPYQQEARKRKAGPILNRNQKRLQNKLRKEFLEREG